jgi:hypothetical protein
MTQSSLKQKPALHNAKTSTGCSNEDPNQGGSHHGTLTLVLLAYFGARDALPCFQARFRAAFLEIFEPLAGFGEVLCCCHIMLVDI